MTAEPGRKKLSPAQVSVMQHRVIEPPYFGKYWDHFDAGMYHCAACDTPLFSSQEKFNAHTGWPAFRKPIKDSVLQFKSARSSDDRIEVRCATCKSNMGIVVPGAEPYIRVYSVCLYFHPESKAEPSEETKVDSETSEPMVFPSRDPLPPSPLPLHTLPGEDSVGTRMSVRPFVYLLVGVAIGYGIGVLRSDTTRPPLTTSLENSSSVPPMSTSALESIEPTTSEPAIETQDQIPNQTLVQ